jgi:hypothetical protein
LCDWRRNTYIVTTESILSNSILPESILVTAEPNTYIVIYFNERVFFFFFVPSNIDFRIFYKYTFLSVALLDGRCLCIFWGTLNHRYNIPVCLLPRLWTCFISSNNFIVVLERIWYDIHILTMDQDDDGSHIKDLAINLIHKMWTSLIRTKQFHSLSEFTMSIVRATEPIGSILIIFLFRRKMSIGPIDLIIIEG